MRIATWNIRYGLGADDWQPGGVERPWNKSSLSGVGKYINLLEPRPDIIGLNEIDYSNRTQDSNYRVWGTYHEFNQADKIAEISKFNYISAYGVEFTGAGYRDDGQHRIGKIHGIETLYNSLLLRTERIHIYS